MPGYKAYLLIIKLNLMILLLAACSPQPGANSPTTIPGGVEIIKITETNTSSGKITQNKLFNQCESASTFKAQIQFSDASSQAGQQKMVIKVGASAEAGVSGIVKGKLEGAIEQHFSTSVSQSQGHQEGVTIEVPPHSQQNYTIIWQETRREGKVEYTENSVAKTADFSYRIGLELLSASGTDIPCPGTEGKATPTRSEITATPKSSAGQATTAPTIAPTAVIMPTTSPSSLLAGGETAYGDGLMLKAAFFCILDCGFDYDYTPAQVAVDFTLRNISGQNIILPSIPSEGLYIKLDTGQRLYVWSNIRWAEKKEMIAQQPLGAGAEIRWRWIFRLTANNGGGVGELLPFPNTSRSLVLFFPEIYPRFSGAQWQGNIPR